MPRHHLRAAAWAPLHAKLVTIPGIRKADVAAPRRFVEAVACVLRTGIARDDLPAGFGEPASLHRRFRRRACEGIRDEPFLEGVPTDALDAVMLDATACEAQRFASGARGGDEEALGRFVRRPGDQDPRGDRRPRPALVLPADARPGGRLPTGPVPAGGPGLRAPDRGSRRSLSSGQRGWTGGTPTKSATGSRSMTPGR